MKKVIYSDKIINKLSVFMSIAGIALYPFIIMREKYKDGGDTTGWMKTYLIQRGKEIKNHELIHFAQAEELLIIGFYFLYVLEFLIKLLIFKGNYNSAYLAISFEREAKENDQNFNYLQERKKYNWVRRILK
jgi:hypothetical protein